MIDWKTHHTRVYQREAGSDIVIGHEGGGFNPLVTIEGADGIVYVECQIKGNFSHYKNKRDPSM